MRIWCKVLAVMTLAALSWSAVAATFGLTPMRVELSAAAPTAVVTVNNSGDAPVTIQVQAYAWTQPGGEDVYTDTREFIVSPPIFTIAPGAAQVLRVALRGKPPEEREQPYRLIFREVPQAEEAATDSALFHIALNMNIPMYVAPARAVAPNAAWSLDSSADGARVKIVNDGTANLRLAPLAVKQGADTLAQHDVFVVLPGATRFIALPKDRLRAGAPLQIEAQSNAGRIDLALPVGKP